MGGALMFWISALKKETQVSSLASLPYEDTERRWLLLNQEILTRHRIGQCLDLDLGLPHMRPYVSLLERVCQCSPRREMTQKLVPELSRHQ